jgi:hypothetical protein
MLARQMVYHMNHAPSPCKCFDMKNIRMESMKNYLLLFNSPAHSEIKYTFEEKNGLGIGHG